MPSPAERYAAARRREEESRTELARFRDGLPFALDDFQVEACTALEQGRGVLVAAPTGAGKTVVGEFAVHLALAAGRKAFYTTPIKALSNQKYAELVARHGPDAVGLLTGDTTVNGEAPVVVMTTEVLRNMLYADSPTLAGLGYVVMDEVHYLADRFRGPVWEEVIIHLPEDVRVVSLSATVSNAEEFGAWLDTVRGGTTVVVSEHRPVPLWQHVLVGTRLLDLFTTRGGDPLGLDAGDAVQLGPGGNAVLNPELARLARGATGGRERGRGAGPRGRTGGRGPAGRGGPGGPGTASRAQVVAALDAGGLLPAITFVFSRAGCDAAVAQCLAWGVRLTTPAERAQIRAVVDERCAALPYEDLAALGFDTWVEGLERGVAAHHAGLLPTFKETVEELFGRGLVRVVFATETLALGVNMPARSVVLERLVKWNGETHADITPGEYTQLTGRAGRRGIDVEGHAVVLWNPGLDPEQVAGLASTRTYPLRSSFRPTYNMAVNLVAQVGRRQAREILETSFAQFQADRNVVGLATQVRRQQEALAGYAEAMTCHLGDFAEYAALRRQVGEREKELSQATSRTRRAEAARSLEGLRTGDVVRVPQGRRVGYAVVLDPGTAAGIEGSRPTVLTSDRHVRRLTALDLPQALEPVGRVKVPRDFNARSPHSRRDLASTLRNVLAEGRQDAGLPGRRHGQAATGDGVGRDVGDDGGGASAGSPPRGRRAGGDASAQDARLADLRGRLRAHPCHGCADREQHARWAERHSRLQRETDALVRRIEGRTNTIARTFDRVCDVLTELGYLGTGGGVTPAGERLRRLYAESDLLVAECLRRDVWRDLDGPGLAACVAALVYQARREEAVSPRVPAGPTGAALEQTVRIWSDLDDVERRHRLTPMAEPDLGLSWAVHRWASGARLEAVLREADLAAGDFVRWCKQVVDLLGQVAAAASADGDTALRRRAEDALDRVRRGVVAYSSLG